MEQTIKIQPITRIEGHAAIAIHLDKNGNVKETRLNILSLRGFEKFIERRPAEEIPRIVSRICGICPWMHHIASNKAVDACFGITPPTTGSKLRELCLTIAHIGDKILHFFFLAAPDFIFGSEKDYRVRNFMSIVKKMPELSMKIVKMRRLSHQMLERFSGKSIHPIAAVVGGFSKPLTEEERKFLLKGAEQLLEFALYSFDYAKENIFKKHLDDIDKLGTIKTGFLGTVDKDGSLNLFQGKLRLMKADGTYMDFCAEKYEDFISEEILPWSYAKFPYAKAWNEGFSMDLDRPKGIYRTNALARLNVADKIATPKAQAFLEEFREKFGRPAQSTLLYHLARLIELVYACEHTIELLKDKSITDPQVRIKAAPKAGRGIGCVEAPRGTLIHDYTTDDNGCIQKANMIVGTTHNIAPMNMSVYQAAQSLIQNGKYDPMLLNKIEMAVRAYDP